MSINAKNDPNLTLFGPVPDVILGYSLFAGVPLTFAIKIPLVGRGTRSSGPIRRMC